MSLGQPDLYIDGQLMQSAKADPRPALAGLRINWGNESRLDFDPASTLAGQLLIKGAMPSYLDVGAPVGLVDPASGRCMFAGSLGPLTAAPAENIAGAMRVSFTAASPLAELVKHKVLNFDWPLEDTAPTRRNRLAGAMPRGWSLGGAAGWDWVNQGRQRHQSIEWITLLERYVRSYNQRYHDTSYYVPGAGLSKRLTVTDERNRGYGVPTPAVAERGAWYAGAGDKPAAATGVALLPAATVHRDVAWEKTPADVVTDVQVSSWGGAFPSNDSTEFEYLMDSYVDNTALQDAYGFRQVKIETALSSNNVAASDAATVGIVNYWLDTQTKWRPTTLQLPDSRALTNSPVLNLMAVDTRHMAVINVPDTAPAPGIIRSFVMAGSATWTGKKWSMDLTLGRTL